MDFYDNVEWTDRGRPQRQAKKKFYSESLIISNVNNNFESTTEKTNKKKRVNTLIDKSEPKVKKIKRLNEVKQNDKKKTEESGHSLKRINGSSDKTITTQKEKSYQPIKKNEFIGRKHIKVKYDDIPRCNCQTMNGQPGCTDISCLNRALHIECTPGTCPCGDLCMNQRFQKREYSYLKKVKTDKKGYGLIADKDIKMNDFIIEYVGEVIDNTELEKRLSEYSGGKHFYCLTLSNGETIDAGRKGNISRFINHSCNPNCVTQKWLVLGEMRIGLFAKRNIKKGDELTFDYQFERVGMKIQKCFCGEPNCAKYLGSRPQEKKESITRRFKQMNHQKHVKTLLHDQTERLDEFPFDPIFNLWYDEKKKINIDDDSYDDDDSLEEKDYNMTTLSKAPVFLRRNAIKTRIKYLTMFRDLMNEEAHDTVEQKAKAKERHASRMNDFSWLLNVDISKLLNSGAIEFDHKEERKSTRNKKI